MFVFSHIQYFLPAHKLIELLCKFYFIFVFGHTHSTWRFLGQKLNLSHSCSLLHSYSNARSLTHWAGPGIEHMRQCQIFNPIVPQQELLNFIYIISFFGGGPHLQHMELPSLGVQSELQQSAYATAIATSYLSRVCDLYLNPLTEARDRTCNLMVPSQIHFCCAPTELPYTVRYV